MYRSIVFALLVVSATVAGCLKQDTPPEYNDVTGQVTENGEPVFAARIHFRNNFDPGGFLDQTLGDSVAITFNSTFEDVYEASLFRYSADSTFFTFFRDTLGAGEQSILVPDSLLSNGVLGYEIVSETRALGTNIFLVNKPDTALIGTYPFTTTNFEGSFTLNADQMALGRFFNFANGNSFQVTDSIQIIVEKDNRIRAVEYVRVEPNTDNFFEITLD